MLNWLKSLFSVPAPTGPARPLRTFSPERPTITQDCVRAEQGGWRIDAIGEQTVRLFDVDNPGVEQCLLSYRAEIKTVDLRGGVQQAISGTTEWTRSEIPFYLRRNQRPDLIKLNVAVQGAGTVWLRNVELLQAPLAS